VNAPTPKPATDGSNHAANTGKFIAGSTTRRIIESYSFSRDGAEPGDVEPDGRLRDVFGMGTTLPP
jgi:hypothetical protein